MSALTTWELGWMVLNILSACKAEERGVVLATASDDNAADGKIGSARRPNYQMVSALPYDDVFRTLLNDCSRLILPMINEIFQEAYTGRSILIYKMYDCGYVCLRTGAHRGEI